VPHLGLSNSLFHSPVSLSEIPRRKSECSTHPKNCLFRSSKHLIHRPNKAAEVVNFAAFSLAMPPKPLPHSSDIRQFDNTNCAMRVLPLLFLVCALSLRPARAQFTAKEAPSTPIRYSRDVPQSVLKRMPRGAKSLFWGHFSPKKGSGMMAIHLFNLTPKEPEHYVTRALQLDLFRWQKRKWHRVNEVSIEYATGFGGTDKAVNAQFFWVDPQQQIPLFKLRVFAPDGFEGPVGDEVSVAFPSGFVKSATVQSWQWGAMHSSFSLGQTSDWSQRDEKGFLEVIFEEGFNGTSEREKGVWHWRGGKFSPWSK